MKARYYEIRLCQNCGLRYPLTEEHSFGQRCPACLGETRAVLKRNFSPFSEGEERGTKVNLSALLDNVRSAWNVGAIFRTSDGLGVRHLYLGGITPTPEIEAVRKTSLGAEQAVFWEYSRNALETASRLKKDGHILIALEQGQNAIPLLEWQPVRPDSRGLILIVGNEVTGVDPQLLEICEQIIYIPMLGSKGSLNVEVAFGIAAFQLLSKAYQS